MVDITLGSEQVMREGELGKQAMRFALEGVLDFVIGGEDEGWACHLDG